MLNMSVTTLYAILTLLLCEVFIVNSICPFSNQICPRMQDFKLIKRSEKSAIADNSQCKAPISCKKSRYRSIDGTCNNLDNPTWGAASMPYARIIPAKYGDGISSFPVSSTGCPLPNARELRYDLFPDKTVYNMDHTLVTMQWGQVVAHDMSLTSGVPQTKASNISCCDANGNFNENAYTNPLCAPINISIYDPVYGPINKVCMDFIRTDTTRDKNCTGPCVTVEPLSSVTAYLDLSIVYGNNKTREREVRALVGGRLKTVWRDGQEWLPQDPQPELTCDLLETPQSPCYLAGDIRVNQNTQLTLLQVLFTREHNRIANELFHINPHWSDEVLYQETRRIIIAETQHITYYHYLPNILGCDNMIKHKLIYPDASGYVNDYDPKVDASVFNEHATSAFRYFHTNIQGILKKYSAIRRMAGFIRISDHMNNPTILEKDDGFTKLARGFTVQLQAEGDKYFDEEVSEFLFKMGNKIGDDLHTIDIQRSRDHGLPSYVDMRAACGLSVPRTFKDMDEFISPENVRKIEQMYEEVGDVDLIIGASLEYKVPGAQVGLTFLIILTSQFHKTRVGDRFFYENGEDPSIAFTPSQLQSIRHGASLARLLCDNVRGMLNVQPDVFKKISFKNFVVPCTTLPRVDLTLWKEKIF